MQRWQLSTSFFTILLLATAVRTAFAIPGSDCPFAILNAGVWQTGLHSYRNAKLQQIGQNKQSDRLRLDFADLIEEDFADYAQFIRNQISLHLIQQDTYSAFIRQDESPDVHDDPVVERAKFLRQEELRFSERSLTDLIPRSLFPAGEVSFFRGFPEVLEVDPGDFQSVKRGDFVEYAESLLEALPTLDTLSIKTPDLLTEGQFVQLSGSRILGPINQLQFPKLTATAARRLRDTSQNFHSITGVLIEHMNERSFWYLCQSRFPGLERIDINGQSADFVPSATLLTQAPFFPHLRKLFVPNQQIGDAFLKVLTDQPSELAALDISFSNLSDQGIESFLKSPLAEQLVYVNFSGYKYTERGVRSFLRKMHPRLNVLYRPAFGDNPPVLMAFPHFTGYEGDDGEDGDGFQPRPPEPSIWKETPKTSTKAAFNLPS